MGPVLAVIANRNQNSGTVSLRSPRLRRARETRYKENVALA